MAGIRGRILGARLAATSGGASVPTGQGGGQAATHPTAPSQPMRLVGRRRRKPPIKILGIGGIILVALALGYFFVLPMFSGQNTEGQGTSQFGDLFGGDSAGETDAFPADDWGQGADQPDAGDPQNPLGDTPSAQANCTGRAHTVRAGETVGGIAGNNWGIAEQIRRDNGIGAGWGIGVGQTLCISTTVSWCTTGRYHYVRPGEWVSSIAPIYGVTQDALKAQNGIGADNRIEAHSILCIPAAR